MSGEKRYNVTTISGPQTTNSAYFMPEKEFLSSIEAFVKFGTPGLFLFIEIVDADHPGARRLARELEELPEDVPVASDALQGMSRQVVVDSGNLKWLQEQVWVHVLQARYCYYESLSGLDGRE